MDENELSIINCTFTTEHALYHAYMPFIKNGGLFVRTQNCLPLNTEAILELKLLDEPEIYKIRAKVIWVTPRGSQGNKPSGIGLQFSDNNNSRLVSNKIETYLAGMLKSTQTTDTM